MAWYSLWDAHARHAGDNLVRALRISGTIAGVGFASRECEVHKGCRAASAEGGELRSRLLNHMRPPFVSTCDCPLSYDYIV
jgi:hypothetical protein